MDLLLFKDKQMDAFKCIIFVQVKDGLNRFCLQSFLV